MIQIKNLTLSRDKTSVLSDISFSLASGSTTFLLGHNGSGKSSLALTLAGHPAFSLSAGDILFENQSIIPLLPEQRARKGIFVSFQHPVEIPGVSFCSFLAESYRSVYSKALSPDEMHQRIQEVFEIVGLPISYAQRALNVGFSGGEKKRSELVQLLFLMPSVVILDEIDSGLDVEGRAAVERTLCYWRARKPDGILVIISHYPDTFDYLCPTAIYTLEKGVLLSSSVTDTHLIQKISHEFRSI